jgi:lysozyme family protein
MVAATYDAAMVRVFADEGGYTNDPVDPGGATNWGITIYDARKYWKSDATPNDVRSMPKAVAADIYRKHYANPMRYDDLPAGFDYSVLDAAINSGVGRAPVWAARALGVAPTRSISDIVRPANAVPDKIAAIQKFWAVRLAFLRSLSTFWRFGKGWSRRCAQGEAAAVRMWLTVGAKMPAPDARKKLDDESRKARGASTKAGTGAATAGSGSAIGGTALDWSHLGIWELLLAGAAIALLVVVAAALIRQVFIHNQRAEAYAEA